MHIYTITNTFNEKVYVGQTTQDIDKRYQQHRNLLNSQKHYNVHLQKSWTKYGPSSFVFDTVARARHELELNDLEIHFIELHQSTSNEFGYNLKSGGNGGTHSLETKRKIGARHKGRVYNDEWRGRMSVAQRRRYERDGLPFKAEHRTTALKTKQLKADEHDRQMNEWIRSSIDMTSIRKELVGFY